MSIQQQLQSASTHHQTGRLAEAEKIYRQILSQQPDQPDALHLLGVLTAQGGQLDAGVQLIRQALRFRPDFPEAHSSLGNVLTGMGQLDDAIASYQQAIRLKADYADAHYNLGRALQCKGRFDAAIAAYRLVIGLKPDYDGAHYNLATTFMSIGKLDEAIGCYRQAIRLKPDLAETHNNLGVALWHMGRFDDAIAACHQAIRFKPESAEAHNNLGNALNSAGQPSEAIASYRQAIRLKPDFAEAHNNLGNALKDIAALDDAMACYQEAIRRKPDYAATHSNLICTLHFHPGHDAAMISAELSRWNRQHAEPLKKLIQPHTNNRDPDRRLRIGYVSPDFCGHVIGRNILPLLREHDHSQMEIFCYASVVHPDHLTGQFQRYADVWCPIVGFSTTRIVDLIRRDQIDVLVDLSLHTGNNHLLVFAHKPAPVQASFAGYPGSTGLDTIEYRLTDPHLEPPESSDHFHQEKLIRLPHTFWCYDPSSPAPVINPPPAQTNGHVTFGCLNNFLKVNQQVVQLWARVLRAVMGSRLILLCPEGSARQSITEMFRKEGIQPDRIELIANQPRPQYLELYHRIDVGLDTFPYNGHTTSLDSNWMGVPVVTLVGQTIVGRAGLSQLTNLGLTALIAYSRERYVEIAARLAADLPRLAELRRTLRLRMQASPLMDAGRFARDIEAAYRQMWRNYLII